MYDELENKGLIVFDDGGNPIFDTNSCPEDNINLNSLTVENRFLVLVCGMNNTGVLDAEWTHELFSSDVFSIEDYRLFLENFLFNEFNWNSESLFFRNLLMDNYGADWERNVSKIMSWRGLVLTQEFLTWADDNNFSAVVDNQGQVTFPALNELQQLFSQFGNATCN